DYDKPTDLESSLGGVESLLLVSGMAAPEARIEQHRNVIRAATSAGVRKIVYTSIQGAESGTGFSSVVQSNRQTEADVRNSGLQWVIGRNGIYIEPDLDYIEEYKKSGEITNCAGDGRCGYTTRDELAFAYSKMLGESKHDGQTYNLHGNSLTQSQLADYLNSAFRTSLTFSSVSVEDYKEDRIAELGEFLGTVIAGIYEGIRIGAVDNDSHFELAAGREHQDWTTFFRTIREN
ncbi:MAG: NAD(P)H-binding protein, partial [Pirellulaceae bacterium]